MAHNVPERLRFTYGHHHPVAVAAALFLTGIFFFPRPRRRLVHHLHQNLREKLSNLRSKCWDYAVETAASFLASVLTNPNLEPLIVNAISKAIDLWVSQNSGEVKVSAMALPARAKDNAMALSDKARGKIREKAGQLGGLLGVQNQEVSQTSYQGPTGQ